MPLLTPDLPFGQPPFGLLRDQVATVIDLVCRGADAALPDLRPGMLEVPTTHVVRKAMRRVKAALSLSNLEIRGEQELDDMTTADPTILGRIDITLKFPHQFGIEDAYVAIECKRVGSAFAELNARYVTQGVDRFVTGQYAAGHDWGFMLGYVLVLPVEDVVKAIDHRIRWTYGEQAKLLVENGHALALAILEGALVQNSSHAIRLKHIFIDMTATAPQHDVEGGQVGEISAL